MTPVLRAVEHSPAGRVAARGSPDEDALLRLGAWLHRTGYRFVTVTPATHARVNVRQSAGDAKSLQDVFAWSRPFRPSLLPREALAWLQKGDGLEYASGQLRSKVRFSTLGDSLFRKNPGAAAGDPSAAASAATMPGGAAEPPATASSLEIPAHLSSTSAATPKPAPASFPIRCDVFMGIPSDLS